MDFGTAAVGYSAFKTVKDVGKKISEWAVWIIGLLFALCVVAFSVNVYIGTAVTILVVIWGLLAVLFFKNAVTDVFGGKTTAVRNMFGTKKPRYTKPHTRRKNRRQ